MRVVLSDSHKPPIDEIRQRLSLPNCFSINNVAYTGKVSEQLQKHLRLRVCFRSTFWQLIRNCHCRLRIYLCASKSASSIKSSAIGKSCSASHRYDLHGTLNMPNKLAAGRSCTIVPSSFVFAFQLRRLPSNNTNPFVFITS